MEELNVRQSRRAKRAVHKDWEVAYWAGLTLVSSNMKTGPMPVSTTSSNSCPPTCGMYDDCYLKFGHGSIHWKKIDEHERGMPWSDFCRTVSRDIHHGQLWRHNQAGDLPGDGTYVDSDALRQLVEANRGKRGFTYTHYPLNNWNVALIEAANANGFTVNVSCDTLAQADHVRETVRAPVAVVLRSDETRKSFYTEAGHKVVVCPTYYQNTNCMRCGICQDNSEERCIVGFPAHGPKRKVINLRLEKAA